MRWLLLGLCACAAPHPHDDVRSVEADLVLPRVSDSAPAPGARVRMTAREYAGTDVHHVLYLPTDWQPGARYPVIVEYAGNGPFTNAFGDTCSGTLDDCCLGYGISGGEGYLWLCLPVVAPGGDRNARRWWGDLGRTVAYCEAVLPRVCAAYGGDPDRVVLTGFSRGAIACNYIGLHDDRIAQRWRAFVCHSHYDGVRAWGYPGDDRASAARRLARLADRPQWISHERSVEAVEDYLGRAAPRGNFTVRPLPFRNHTGAWVLRDVPLRDELRAFVRRAVR